MCMRREKNIQAANRREEERQAGCHTSKTGTQLQQTAEITEHEGKRNTRCERHMYPVIKTQIETGFRFSWLSWSTRSCSECVYVQDLQMNSYISLFYFIFLHSNSVDRWKWSYRGGREGGRQWLQVFPMVRWSCSSCLVHLNLSEIWVFIIWNTLRCAWFQLACSWRQSSHAREAKSSTPRVMRLLGQVFLF